MMKEEDLPPQVEYWLSPNTKHDCYFDVGPETGPTERIGSFKAFLIGYSEPLRAMLQESELAEDGVIPIIDTQPDTFRIFLKCLYAGLTNTMIRKLSFQISCDVLFIADKYLVTQLKEKLIDQCLNTLSSEISCINVACSSKVFMQEENLKEALSKIVQCKIKSVVSSEQFLQINDDSLLWILQLDPLDIDEVSLWQAVLRWAKNKTNSYNGSVIRRSILKMLKYIRFCSINVQVFCEKVVPTNVLTDKEINQICKYYGSMEMPTMTFICNTVICRNRTDDFKLEPREVTFSYRVNDILSLTGIRRLKKFEFQNCNWHLRIQKCETTLALYLECRSLVYDPSWKCSIEKVSLTLVGRNGQSNSHTLSFYNQTFTSKSSGWGFGEFILWSKVVDPLGNYLDNNSIVVSVTMTNN